ncbi:MAG: HlyC/CorC family transporter [Saprospiraceae bacterium]|nr:HlyC/CorC family transporter [Saprospiraceae bacterium]
MIFEILLTLGLVLLNGFFVAAEFSIVKVRYSQIHLKAEQGNKYAKRSEYIINHLDTYLSATQLGITFASLGLGWVGEPIVSKGISNLMVLFSIEISDELLHRISLPIGFLVITVLHIVFGELAPKSLAIRKAEATTLAISYPLYWFFMIFRPFIWLMNAMSNFFLKMIGIKPVGEQEIHSVDELRLLVDQSKAGGELQAGNYEIIKNAFDFTDHVAKQIMVPRNQVFALDIELPLEEIIREILDNSYSRVPVFQDSIDNIIGIVYAKDIFRSQNINSETNIKDILHPVFYVYETKRISQILTDFQKQHLHMAVVIDEFGGTQGVITLEDILEELVGEIQDEDDDERQVVEKMADGSYVILATHSLLDINELLPIPLPVNENYNSLSGLLLFNFNRIPKLNEKLLFKNYEFTISKLQRRTIQSVTLRYIEKTENSSKDFLDVIT